MITIGTNTFGYNQIRNFTGIPVQDVRFVKVQDWYKIRARLHLIRSNWMHLYYAHVFKDLGLKRCDMFHFFNTLSFGKKPWVVTLETFVPKWGKVSPEVLRSGFELLAGDACKAIIPMSENSAAFQRLHTHTHAPDLAETILSKVQVLKPAQAPLIASPDLRPPVGDIIRCIFVGSDFFRKGGLEMLEALDTLVSRGIRNLHITIVSMMKYGDYASHTTEAEFTRARSLMVKHAAYITHHGLTSNEKVLDLIRGSDVGLLPTWADAFGYFALEAQAAACPVVTTDVRCLPEVNSEELGWVIHVEKDKASGEGKVHTPQERKKMSETIREQLTEILAEISAHPERIRPRGAKAWARICAEHDPASRAAFLGELYHRIVR